MTFFSKFIAYQERRAKVQLLGHFRSMTDRQLQDCGISTVLLAEGVKAWPWTVASDETIVQADKWTSAPKATTKTTENATNAESFGSRPIAA